MADRIQRKREKGWRMPPNTVQVSRPTLWGNPFIIGKHGTRAECVDMYARLMCGLVCITTGNAIEQKSSLLYVVHNIEKLRGKNLACWCPLDKPCHVDILLRLANQ
ncbi:MAG: DUF4326 domain-containing protein [Proteobacteria bacterium]|nr:DUF4326 domain-containing protein [Pseudomonadota bacterium]